MKLLLYHITEGAIYCVWTREIEKHRRKRSKGRRGINLKQEEKTEENIDLTATENERVLKGAYRSFAIPGIPKVDIDGYADPAKPNIKALIEGQMKEMQSTKVIITL